MNTAEEQRMECNDREWNAMNTTEEHRVECNEYSGGTESGMQ